MSLRSSCSGQAGGLPQARRTTQCTSLLSPSFSKHWPLKFTDHWIFCFTLQWLWASICCREFLKQLGALRIDKSNPLDACPLPHNALGNFCLAYVYLADLPEPLPLIPFTVWRISAISAQNLISATKNTPWFLRQMPLRPNLSPCYCTLMGTYVFS